MHQNNASSCLGKILWVVFWRTEGGGDEIANAVSAAIRRRVGETGAILGERGEFAEAATNCSRMDVAFSGVRVHLSSIWMLFASNFRFG